MSEPTTTTQDISSKFNAILKTLSDFRTQVTAVQNEIRSLEKDVQKTMRTYSRQLEKKKPKSQRAPSGFARPSAISDELCQFLDKDAGTQVARTEVTKALISYIKENKLEDKDHGQDIVPDEKLRSLLGLKAEEKLSYFTLQSHMNQHFPKSVKQKSASQ